LVVEDHCLACFIPVLKLVTHIEMIHFYSLYAQVTAAFHLLIVCLMDGFDRNRRDYNTNIHCEW